MPVDSAYENVIPGPIILKTGKPLRRKNLNTSQSRSRRSEDTTETEYQTHSTYSQTQTESQRKFEAQRLLREEKEIEKRSKESYQDRLATFNKNLEKSTDHN